MPSGDFNQLQTGLTRSLRTTGLFTESTCPWISTWVSGHLDNIMNATAKERERKRRRRPKAILGIALQRLVGNGVSVGGGKQFGRKGSEKDGPCAAERSKPRGLHGRCPTRVASPLSFIFVGWSHLVGLRLLCWFWPTGRLLVPSLSLSLSLSSVLPLGQVSP